MTVRELASAIGFWAGTLLPIAYVPFFFVGIGSPRTLWVFVGLVVLNVLALVVGHEYRRSRSEPR